MEYLAAFGIETTLLYLGSVVALAVVGALLQARWRRGGPAMAFVAVLTTTLALVESRGGRGWASVSKGPSWASVTAAMLWFGLPLVGALLGLSVFRKRSHLARVLGAVACGLVVAFLAPLLVLTVACLLSRGDCL